MIRSMTKSCSTLSLFIFVSILRMTICAKYTCIFPFNTLPLHLSCETSKTEYFPNEFRIEPFHCFQILPIPYVRTFTSNFSTSHSNPDLSRVSIHAIFVAPCMRGSETRLYNFIWHVIVIKHPVHHCGSISLRMQNTKNVGRWHFPMIIWNCVPSTNVIENKHCYHPSIQRKIYKNCNNAMLAKNRKQKRKL